MKFPKHRIVKLLLKCSKDQFHDLIQFGFVSKHETAT